MSNELQDAMTEVRLAHPGLWENHIKLLLGTYTISEIQAGTIREGVFYPSYEIGKQWGRNKKKPLTYLRLWQPRKKNQ